MEQEAKVIDISPEDEQAIIETGNIENFLGTEELRDKVVEALARHLMQEAFKNGLKVDNLEEKAKGWAENIWTIKNQSFAKDVADWISENKIGVKEETA